MRTKELMGIFNDVMKEKGVYGEFRSSIQKDGLSRRMSRVFVEAEPEAIAMQIPSGDKR